jgi:hypothetical protein
MRGEGVHMDVENLPGKPLKRDKIRSAWISFAGRIVAQLIGAVATVTLGAIVLGGRPPAVASAAAATPTVLIATPVRTHGETVIVMLPAGKDGKVDPALAAQVAESFEKSKAISPRANARPRMPIDPLAPLSGDPSGDTREIPVSPRE